MTHAELGDRAGLGRMSVSNLEAGRRRVHLADALALVHALDVPLADMLSPAPLVLRTETRVD